MTLLDYHDVVGYNITMTNDKTLLRLTLNDGTPLILRNAHIIGNCIAGELADGSLYHINDEKYTSADWVTDIPARRAPVSGIDIKKALLAGGLNPNNYDFNGLLAACQERNVTRWDTVIGIAQEEFFLD